MQASEKNRGTATVALSGFDSVVEEHRRDFADAGVLLVRYDQSSSAWIDVLKACLQRYVQRSRFDFVVICALDKEREAFNSTRAVNLELKNILGLDCMTMDIGEYSGACIKLPRMGLVEASIISTRAIEIFSPKLLAMSGICAGVAGQSDIGTLIVADMCWEYQAGKWADKGFRIEHYDVGLTASTRTALNHFAAQDKGALKLKTDLTDDLKLRAQPVQFSPMATGSAVIASQERIDAIAEQHRKMAGLDMEMFGLYKAADLAGHDMIVFGAKTVVDLADSSKGDQFHRYGAVLSARFVCDAIPYLLKSQAG